ncbi:hypothetical protein [Lyticum sinuosum]|uniref:Uncharacterized protein n=1 Tax=Lyticum sinuosum TaxID=1332059 RepID=A0AAE4VLS4_9RICK|nr:hypothetical protein [Lyticum sinuosum]MDZ5760978.1 hypothetical protein [Lyticum sinuosum]
MNIDITKIILSISCLLLGSLALGMTYCIHKMCNYKNVLNSEQNNKITK